jgi:hypothetical protein
LTLSGSPFRAYLILYYRCLIILTIKSSEYYTKLAEDALDEYKPAGSIAYEDAIYKAIILRRLNVIREDTPDYQPTRLTLLLDICPDVGTTMLDVMDKATDGPSRSQQIGLAINDLIEEGSICEVRGSEDTPRLLIPLEIPIRPAT